MNITCVVNGHREGHIIFPTIKCVQRAIDYATVCGISCELLVILDNPDSETIEVAENALGSGESIRIVEFADLAWARNYAAEIAAGEFTTYVDADDMWCKTWLVDSYIKSKKAKSPSVLHPEFSVYFGDRFNHVMHHLDMNDADFEFESIYRQNYWTALTFSATDVFRKFPYKKNLLESGFGYEDWTWNVETIQAGIVHSVVRGSSHFIRRQVKQGSLLDQTNSVGCIPRLLPLYRDNFSKADSNLLSTQ